MALASVSDESVGRLQRAIERLGRVHGEYGAELLPGQRLVGADRVDGRQQQPRVLGDLPVLYAFELEHPCEVVGRAADSVGVQASVDEEAAPDPVHVTGRQDHAASVPYLVQERRCNSLQHDHGLLARADDALVERLGQQDVIHRHRDIGALIDQRRCVSRPDPDGWRARRV